MQQSRTNLRHARIINRPARLQRPHKRRIHKPAKDVCLGSVDSKRPDFRVWIEGRTLLRGEVVGAHARKKGNDDVGSGYLEGVEDLLA